MTNSQSHPDQSTHELVKRLRIQKTVDEMDPDEMDKADFIYGHEMCVLDGRIAADRIEALTAENERLREALGKVRFLAQVNYEQNDNLNSRGRRDLWRIAECARAALGDTQ